VGGYRLTLGDGTTAVVDAVVLATPAFASGELLAGIAPQAATGLSSIPYVTSATVSLAFRRTDVAHPLRGFGYVTPRTEGRGVMATTWSSAKFSGRAPEGYVLVRSFVGRAGFEQYAGLDDDELLALVREELVVVLGIHATPVLERVFRWPLGMPQYRVGHADLVGRIEDDVARVPGVEIAGGAYHGIGIGDCIREGRAAAQRAIEHIEGLPEDPVPPQPADVPAGDGLID
jgi:oxygen-dependent protoporphyrinogen oxidase